MALTKVQQVEGFLGDTRSPEEFASFFSEAGRYRLGNSPTVVGRDAIKAASAGFLKGIKSAKHDVKGIWEHDGTVAAEMVVTYVKQDGKEVSLPCLSVFEFDGDQFGRLSIYMDPGPLASG